MFKKLNFNLYLGKSFAIIQIKQVLIRILSEYEVNSCQDTPKSSDFLEGILTTVKTDIPIVLKKR